ncbi:MAG: purine-nucleoside phosphorylase [Bdellovibrionales bacterium]|nr:purine-nucleoside phosphorylase [Bdellovibrionales bacterium]
MIKYKGARLDVIERLQETTHYIRSLSQLKPRVGIILGSGLGALVKYVQIEKEIPYEDLPNFPTPSVEGHKGRLILGEWHGIPLAILQGRVHYYEGHKMDAVVYPIRTLAMLGIEIAILTNSAGGLDPKMTPGDFMVIEDHINLMGNNPLMGPNIKNLGPRFPDMTEAYDRKLTAGMIKTLKDLDIPHWQGVYCGVSGPTYETPAEVRFLQTIGGKAVGMSTVPEAIAANHLGLRVCAMSCVTNPAAGIHTTKLTHDEVTEIANSVEKQFCDFFDRFLSTELADKP